MGEWHQTSDRAYYYDAIRGNNHGASRLSDSDLAELLTTLNEAGLIVRKPYYVPDAEELFGMMSKIRYHLMSGLQGCRWVMCRETIDSLAAKYSRTRIAAPPRFNAGFWTDTDLPSAALELEIELVMQARRYWDPHNPDTGARLFGIEIRVDPAARSPMFEIETEATKRAPL